MIKHFYTKKQKKFIFTHNIQQKGFSLIEMMVVVVILGLIILALVTFFTGGTKAWVAGQSQLKAQREARQAIDRMVREIRHGKVVTTGTTDSITVTIPALGSESAYNVTYNLIGTTINRNGNPLINNVKTLSFGYPYASKVHILLEVDVDDDGNPDISLNNDVNLRNF